MGRGADPHTTGNQNMRMMKLLPAILSLITAGTIAGPIPKASAQGISIAEKAQKCMNIEGADERAKCYDAAVKPEPSRTPPAIKGIRDCRRIADINERLGCFDKFAAQIPKFTH
jgi:hypothetical protein